MGGHLTARLTITNIALTKEGSFLCSLLANTATYEGEETVRGYEDEGDTAGDGHTPTYMEGAEVGISGASVPQARHGRSDPAVPNRLRRDEANAPKRRARHSVHGICRDDCIRKAGYQHQ